jgi:hypothetical protein
LLRCIPAGKMSRGKRATRATCVEVLSFVDRRRCLNPVKSK